MNNKVKFLRGTSGEYAVAEKDSDAIYFTTDDGKLYIGDKEVSGSDITIDDTLSDTSTNPVQNKVIKQVIDNKADKTVATTSADGLMSAEDKGKLDAFEITTDGGKLHDKNIATTDDIPDLTPYAKKTDVPNIKVNEAVNADTLGEKSADDFAQIINLGRSQTDTKTAVSQAGKTTTYCCGAWIDFPAESPDGQGTLISTNYTGSGIAGTDPMWVVQFFISARTGMVYKRFINGPTVDSWCEVYSAANKPYVTGSSSGTSFTTASYDSEPSFAICDDNGTIKYGNIYQMSDVFRVSFENLSDTTHQYMIFK